MSEEKEQEAIEKIVTTEDLRDGLELETGKRYRIVLPSIKVHIELGPNDSAHVNDKFTLFSTDKDRYYKQTLTVADDKVPDDDAIDLEFVGVRKDLNYTLEITPGDGSEKYTYFEDTPYSELEKDWLEEE
jgi:hypothetical protein